MFSDWTEDVHVVWVYYFDYFFSLLLLCELSLFFDMKCYRSVIDSEYLVGTTPLTVFFWVFWNFADVFSMEWRRACGLGIILYFFSLCELSLCFWHKMLSKCIYNRYLVGAAPLTVFLQLFWNFADVFWMEWRFACGFGTIMIQSFRTDMHGQTVQTQIRLGAVWSGSTLIAILSASFGLISQW